MAELLNGEGQRSLYAQLQHFKEADESRNTLLQTIVDDYHKLESLYDQKCKDLDSEQTMRRHWQDEQGRARRELNALKQQTEGNPFALVLIDGDGVIFRDELLQGGAEGGAKAAYVLFHEAQKALETYHEGANNWSIMVQVFANLDGLSRKLLSIGLIHQTQELYSFARAFSCNQPLFSFVDVGMGKERADHKMKETFRLFLKNTHCKHIIFGGCHDNGYLPNLEPYSQDRGIANRITLLESTPAERGYHRLGFDVSRFNKVFRNDPLPDHRMSYLPDRSAESRQHSDSTTANDHSPNNVFATPLATPSDTPTNSYSSPLPPIGRPATVGRGSTPLQTLPGQTVTTKQLPNPIAPPKPAATVPTPSPETTATTATYAKPGPDAASAKVINIATTKAPARKFLLLNVNQQRVDRALPKPDEGAAKALAARIKQAKVCNNWHLLGKCSNGDYCNFTHAPKLCNSEQVALRSKARERPCTKSGGCRDLDCVSGHHCPRGEACNSQWCMFGDPAHFIDLAIKFKEYENGDLESVS